MITEQEKIDHAIAMLQAFKDGKRVERVINGVWQQLINYTSVSFALYYCDEEVRIAPEPLEEWKVVYWNNDRKFTNTFKTQQEAERLVSKISYHPIAFEIERRPPIIYHMRQVL